MQVIIMSCSGQHWYKDKIGKLFKVCGVQGGVDCKKFVVKTGKTFKEVLATDCQVI